MTTGDYNQAKGKWEHHFVHHGRPFRLFKRQQIADAPWQLRVERQGKQFWRSLGTADSALAVERATTIFRDVFGDSCAPRKRPPTFAPIPPVPPPPPAPPAPPPPPESVPSEQPICEPELPAPLPPIRADDKRLYKVREAARFLSASTRWVREQIRSGELEGFDLRDWTVSGAGINAFLDRRRVVATKTTLSTAAR